MKNAFFRLFMAAGLLIFLSGCSTVYEAFIGVDGDTRDQFAATPPSCEKDLADRNSIAACTKELMPLGLAYGQLALGRIEDYGEHAKPETKKMLPEFRAEIEQNCIEHINHADELFAEGEQDVAVEIALGSLSDCFFRADAVMERSYGGMDTAHLRDITSRALDTMYQASLSDAEFSEEG